LLLFGNKKTDNPDGLSVLFNDYLSAENYHLISLPSFFHSLYSAVAVNRASEEEFRAVSQES
jgi:hypothetical protein